MPQEKRTTGGCGCPRWYEIRVAGCLAEHWASWFEGLELAVEPDETVLSGCMPDQAALHGVLRRIEQLGLPLVAIREIGPEGEERHMAGGDAG